MIRARHAPRGASIVTWSPALQPIPRLMAFSWIWVRARLLPQAGAREV
jgi:hypothetical protein